MLKVVSPPPPLGEISGTDRANKQNIHFYKIFKINVTKLAISAISWGQGKKIIFVSWPGPKKRLQSAFFLFIYLSFTENVVF